MLSSIRLHRLLAGLIAAFAFWVSSVEVLLPEIHDGDAFVVAESPAPASTVGAQPAASSVESQMHVEASGEHHTLPGSTTPSSNHGPHVDHCGHGHGATAANLSVARVATLHPSAPRAEISTLASVDLPTHKRPPIA